MKHLSVLSVALALAVGLVSCSTQNSAPVGGNDVTATVAPIMIPHTAIPIEGSYIVVLRDGTGGKGSLPSIQSVGARMANVQSFVARYALNPSNSYDAVFPGFSAQLTSSQVASLRADPQVESVEEDQMIYAEAQTLPAGIDRVDADLSSTLAGNGSGTVTGVDIFIIDTGIDPKNSDLNVVESKSFVKGAKTGADDNGHGTHVSGTAAARDNATAVVGIAPGANLHAIKVLDHSGSGSFSQVIAGINYVTNWKLAHSSSACVANMSLGAYVGTTSYNSLDAAVVSSINAGVTYCIAAGNSNDDASLYSPAHVTEAITVGAYDATKVSGVYNNSWASFSNYGAVVDILAPGVNVLSTYLRNGTATMSGTSMATPHVTGSAALYLSQNPTASPAAVQSALNSAATNGANTAISGVPASTTTTSVYDGTF